MSVTVALGAIGAATGVASLVANIFGGASQRKQRKRQAESQYKSAKKSYEDRYHQARLAYGRQQEIAERQFESQRKELERAKQGYKEQRSKMGGQMLEQSRARRDALRRADSDLNKASVQHRRGLWG